MHVPDLGRIGIWGRELRFGERGAVLDAVAELESLGFGALWVPGGAGGPLLEVCADVLAATHEVPVATGILNFWWYDPADVARDHAAIDAAHPGRFLLGLGVGHVRFLDAESAARARRPLQATAEYLDALERHAPQGTDPARVLAALGPRMLELAGRRTLGTHPFMVPVAHTRRARETLGPGKLVAPELSVILETDITRARERAREEMTLYFGLPNYTNEWRRLGYTDEDLREPGSDRLVDDIYAYGALDAIAERIREHHEAGADHVCLRVVTNLPMTGVDEPLPREAWRELAALL
jgi:probable F420-dependent oxidoreductase